MINLKEIKSKIFTKENFYFLIIIILIFGLDRYSKIRILENFSENKYFINDYLNLDLIWNIGIGFGLLSVDSQLLYNLISTIIGLILIFLFILAFKSDKTEKFIFSIIIGGALGNFYDRVIFKAVPDFIDIHYENFHWFIFNFADVFITLGVFFMILMEFIDINKKNTKNEKL